MSLRRADWRVDKIPQHGEAITLISRWHYSGSAPTTSTYRHGLYRADEFMRSSPYGVALWIPPTRSAAEHLAGADWQGVLSLSRLAIDPEMPTNAASFLLGASMRMIDRARWPVLVTYADTAQGHTGAIYKATNWVSDGPVAAGDVWADENGRLCGRKRGGTTLTVAEMRTLGFVRREAAPKIRFTHRVAP